MSDNIENIDRRLTALEMLHYWGLALIIPVGVLIWCGSRLKKEKSNGLQDQ